MSANVWLSIIVVGYVVLYGLFAVGGILWLRKRRKTKWPFKESDKLLRGPGEGLRRRIAKIDEDFIFEYLGSFIAAVLIGPFFIYLAQRVGLTGWRALLAGFGGLAVTAAIGARRCMRLWMERSKYYLGWFGERLVAEKLRPLQLQGYRVFHDIPAEPGKNGFNIDHVAVGPAGVFVIEVKTRRKGAARPGFKDHEVSFDGMRLSWPSGDDPWSIQQAINEADWLAKWIFERTGLKVSVRAILTCPGWYVRESPSPALRVVNPDFLPAAITGRGEVTLQPRDIDLIARQLDALCRDVED